LEDTRLMAYSARAVIVRLHQDIGISQAAADYPAAVKRNHIAKGTDLQDAEATRDWQPRIYPIDPIGDSEILIPIALATLQHQDDLSVGLGGPALVGLFAMLPWVVGGIGDTNRRSTLSSQMDSRPSSVETR
jgi:hypothetical protein